MLFCWVQTYNVTHGVGPSIRYMSNFVCLYPTKLQPGFFCKIDFLGTPQTKIKVCKNRFPNNSSPIFCFGLVFLWIFLINYWKKKLIRHKNNSQQPLHTFHLNISILKFAWLGRNVSVVVITVWGSDFDTGQEICYTKKSTFLMQSLWNLAKITRLFWPSFIMIE